MNDTTSTLQHVTSTDGTRIAIDRLGDGPPIVLACGGSTDRMSNAGVAAILASDFTVFNYDRRGRGDSSDTPPYAVDREVEDIAAVIDAAGGPVALYGTSSGAALALEAARQLDGRVSRLLLWEPPFFVDPKAGPPVDQIAQYERMLAEGRRGDAVEYFMSKVVGLPPEFVAFAKTQPFWASTEAIAHTLPYDATIMGDYSVPTERAATVTARTLVLTGGASFPFLHESAAALAAAMPDARTQVLEGQEHNVDAAVIAAAMKAFLEA